MSFVDVLYNIVVWDIDRARREQAERDFLPQANAKIKRAIAESWRRGELSNPKGLTDGTDEDRMGPRP